MAYTQKMAQLSLGVAALTMVGACGSKAPEKKDKDDPTNVIQIGILPDAFRCESVAPDAELAAVVGGRAELVDANFAPPMGAPKPCSYQVTTTEGAQEVWSFDIDCRSEAMEQAGSIMGWYVDNNNKLVQRYTDAVSDGGPIVDDAGVELKAPEGSKIVDVGRKALDHHGQGLIFVDDDAPCYVRVVGPDEQRRMALAKMLNTNLTETNAPMKPVFRKRGK